MAVRWVSVFDLLQFERSREAILNDDFTEFYNILYEIGIDIDKEIDVQYVTHRPLSTKTPFTGLRWVGEERRDKEWLESEWCTRENKLELLGAKDVSFLKEIIEMSKLPQFTQRAMDHLKGEPHLEFIYPSKTSKPFGFGGSVTKAVKGE